MSQPPNRPAGPRLNVRGAVDLSGLAQSAPAGGSTTGGAPAGGGPGGYVVELTERTFQTVVQQSAQVPVIVAFVSANSPASQQVVADLQAVVNSLAGKALLALVDFNAQAQLVAAFKVQGVPTVMAVIAGQPIPLFSGAASREQIQQVIDQVLQVAAQNGITGTVAAAPGGDPAEDAQPAEPEVPEHLLPAEEALAAGDLDGAIAAFETAVKQQPGDPLAKEGLARAQFVKRVSVLDPATVRQAAADDPKNVKAQLDAADLELYGGNIADAFNRLIDTVRVTREEDREAARARLVELFEIVGPDQPELVAKARRSLSAALF